MLLLLTCVIWVTLFNVFTIFVLFIFTWLRLRFRQRFIQPQKSLVSVSQISGNSCCLIYLGEEFFWISNYSVKTGPWRSVVVVVRGAADGTQRLTQIRQGFHHWAIPRWTHSIFPSSLPPFLLPTLSLSLFFWDRSKYIVLAWKFWFSDLHI